MSEKEHGGVSVPGKWYRQGQQWAHKTAQFQSEAALLCSLQENISKIEQFFCDCAATRKVLLVDTLKLDTLNKQTKQDKTK